MVSLRNTPLLLFSGTNLTQRRRAAQSHIAVRVTVLQPLERANHAVSRRIGRNLRARDLRGGDCSWDPRLARSFAPQRAHPQIHPPPPPAPFPPLPPPASKNFLSSGGRRL